MGGDARRWKVTAAYRRVCGFLWATSQDRDQLRNHTLVSSMGLPLTTSSGIAQTTVEGLADN